MGFVKSIFGGDSGASFQGAGSANNIKDLDIQRDNNRFAERQMVNTINGKGPNLAQDQLNAATNQNIEQANAILAGQKGVNPALAAKLSAQNAANANQLAAGQSAMLRDQQIMGATQGLSQASLGAANNAQAGIDSQNSADAKVQAGNQASQQGFLGGLGSAIMPTVNGLLKPAAAAAAPIMSAGGPALSPLLLAAEGGEVPQMPITSFTAPAQPMRSKASQYLSSDQSMQMGMFAEGGNVSPDQWQSPETSKKFEAGFKKNPLDDAMSTIKNALGAAADKKKMARGGRVPALVSPGEVYIPPSKVQAAAQASDPRQVGDRIPGKAKVKGNSFKNDTVPATLEEGGIVLPRSVMEHKDPAKKAHEFVTKILANRTLKARR